MHDDESKLQALNAKRRREGSPAGDASELRRSDAGEDPRVAAEHPKGTAGPLPPGHPSDGMIDESGQHR